MTATGKKGSGIAASLGDLQHLRTGPQVVSPAVSGYADTRVPRLVLHGTSKRAHPDYVQLKAYVRGDTKKAAMRKAEDEGCEDFSVLVQQLLEEYLGR